MSKTIKVRGFTVKGDYVGLFEEAARRHGLRCTDRKSHRIRFDSQWEWMELVRRKDGAWDVLTDDMYAELAKKVKKEYVKRLAEHILTMRGYTLVNQQQMGDKLVLNFSR